MRNRKKLATSAMICSMIIMTAACQKEPEKEEVADQTGTVSSSSQTQGSLSDGQFENLPVTSEDDFSAEVCEGGCSIYRYDGEDEVIVIPETINGLNVVGISNEFIGFGSEVKTVVIGPWVKTLEKNAFDSAINLEQIFFTGDGLTSIGKECFSGCTNLCRINLPDTVTYIGEAAFARCDSLASINIPAELEILQGQIFSGNEKLKEIIFPENSKLKSIGYYTFCDTGLVDVTLPKSLEYIGTGAFDLCASLKNVTVQSGNTRIADIHYDTDAFSDCHEGFTLSVPDNSIAYDYAVDRGIDTVISDEDPNTVKKEPESDTDAVDIDALVSKYTENKDEWSYAECAIDSETSDGKVTISCWCPSGTSPKVLVVPDTYNGKEVVAVHDFNFSYPDGLEAIIFGKGIKKVENTSSKGIKRYIFAGDALDYYGPNTTPDNTVEEVYLPDNTKELADMAFAYTSKLKTFVVPANLPVIPSQCFAESAVSEIIFKKNGKTRHISENAFEDMANLESITLPETIETVGFGAFNGCKNIKDIYIENDYVDYVDVPTNLDSIFSNHTNCVIHAGDVSTTHMQYNDSLLFDEFVCSFEPCEGK